MSENDFYLAFSCSPGIGPLRFKQLLKKFGSAKDAWNAFDNNDLRSMINDVRIGEKTLEKVKEFKTSFDIDIYKKRLKKENVRFIAQIDKEYPQSLKVLKDAPIGLFTKGNVSCLTHNKTIGVVGTRKTTSYGRQVTESLVSSLVSYNFTIISGLALGIDAIAHRTTVDNHGLTTAVLGCGVDCCYPRENQNIYNSILDANGLIISEYPLGVQPQKGSFPARNRIIAALSNAILVTEAGADSGSLITADYAKKFGKTVFAVPGPITSRQSDGTSYLIKNGAKLVQNVQDIIKEFSIPSRRDRFFNSQFSMKSKKINFQKLNLTNDEKKILELLQNEPLQFDELLKRSKIPTSKLSIIISSLEMQGYVRNIAGRVEIIGN